MSTFTNVQNVNIRRMPRNVTTAILQHILIESYFKCSSCNFETVHRSEFDSHLSLHPNNQVYDSSEVDCKHSSEIVAEVSPSLSHTDSSVYHSGENSYGSEQVESRLQVDLTESCGTRFKCSDCEYQTNFRGDLNRHLLIHSNTKAHQCTECNFQTKLKGNLKKHTLIHSETKLYNCNKCSFATNQKGHLKIHLLNHSEIRLFKCPNCNYKTNRKGSLNLHLLIHSDSKLYKCSECTFETNYKRSLNTHLMTHFRGINFENTSSQ
ncbi:Zinc finger protein [Armadillidium nasatum]|uniref:Zinc finger protein n=1 Tax=Armadillidium nasatum TaxID=96803 RepID=A0A5N5TAC4_9CRUS|nr:Zinc finger protein [Armadillidium nasatum]